MAAAMTTATPIVTPPLAPAAVPISLRLAIFGISSIHLLRTFIEAGPIGSPTARIISEGVLWQTVIHSVFILSAIGIACVDRLSQTKS